MIAVDAMGGDHAPHAIIQGSILAAQRGIPILLCGDEIIITNHLNAMCDTWQSLPITIQACAQAISMEDEPAIAVKTKQDSSLVIAMRSVVQGKSCAFVSAGNSGAVLVASILYSGRLEGVSRPAVAGFLPTKKNPVLCLDLGANVDCKNEYLYQFARMGSAYMMSLGTCAHPRVSLLSNGHEPYKGSLEVKKAYDLLRHSKLNFIGNIEARDVFEGNTDVVVTDGFVGNVMLKAIQGTAGALFFWVNQEAQQLSFMKRFLLWINRGLFQRIKDKTDYASVGGALLLGVNHPVILAHGRSDARAICNAIIYAHRMVKEKHLEQFKKSLQELVAQEYNDSYVVLQNGDASLDI